MKEKLQFSTLCTSEVHTTESSAHILPIHASSSFRFDSVEASIEVFTGKKEGYVYGRYGNPTIKAVESKLATLEGYDLEEPCRALLTSSGMSAIHTLLLSQLRPGDAVLTQGNLYGGTTELLLKTFGSLDIETIMVDLSNAESVRSALIGHNNIKCLYLETPTNPTLDCIDIKTIASIAKENGCLVAVDNTFATPYLQRPLTLGADFVIHSTTKYLNGHGNGIAGVIIGRSSEVLWPIIWQNMKLAGTNCNPFDAWLVHNGLKTLPLRMDRQCQNAKALAQFLDHHPSVAKVNYPGLATHASHQIAKDQMTDFGAMLSFEVKGEEKEALAVMNGLDIASIAPTLGDVDTLVLHPWTSSHLNVDNDVCLKNGITPNLIRVSVGIEDQDDLVQDFRQAIEKVISV